MNAEPPLTDDVVNHCPIVGYAPSTQSPTFLDIQIYLATRSGEEMNKTPRSILGRATLTALTEFVFQTPPPLSNRETPSTLFSLEIGSWCAAFVFSAPFEVGNWHSALRFSDPRVAL